MDRREINIDLDKIMDVAHRGVRRASVFMGLGVNAALHEEFQQYQLTHITNLQLIPDTSDLKKIGHFKEEFKIWIEGNGLREMLETFAVFLDRIHEAALLISTLMDKGDMTALSPKQVSFNREGFPSKLKILRSKYAIGPKHPDYLVSINKARNCLSHRRGIVGQEDVDQTEKLRVAWLGMDVYAQTPSGERHSLLDVPPGGLLLPEGAGVYMQFIERDRLFERGAPLRLSTRDLAEICWFFSREAVTTRQSIVEYAQAKGVPLKDKSTEAVRPTP